MAKTYRLLRDRFEHKAGTLVYQFSGSDYGLASDDTFLSGVEHTTITLNADGSGPFFTVPVSDLQATGLRVEITYPDREKPFIAYPASPAQADRWVADAKAKGLPCRILPAAKALANAYNFAVFTQNPQLSCVRGDS